MGFVIIYFALLLVVDIDDYDWQEEYFAMNQKFSNILDCAVEEIFATNLLTRVQVFLTGINRNITKAIKEANDEVQLMALLRNFFSLSNISTLKEFFERCKIEHDAQELDKLLKDRDAISKKILAKNFASEAIKIYENNKRCSISSTVSYW